MFDFYFAWLNALFAPVLTLPPILSEIVIAAIMTVIITLFYKKLVDQDRMKKIREETKKLQDKIKEVKNKDPEQANKLMSEVMKMTNEQMKMSMKPMLPTLLIAAVFFPWVASLYKGAVAILPFSLPFFGNDFGWLMWYLVVSVPMSQVARKMMGVN
ncbi:MAG: EMC3/TMCO1 family protein [Candidatus Aenigmatarchaeota archaeon]